MKRKISDYRLVFALFALWPAYPAEGGIQNIQVTPAPPAMLQVGTHVTVSFDYVDDSATLEAVYISLLDDNGRVANQHTEVTFDPDHVTAWFTVTGTANASVRSIYVNAETAYHGECEYMCPTGEIALVDASYFFGDWDGWSITNIQLDPGSPALLLAGDRVRIAFDYNGFPDPGIRILFRPWTSSAVTSSYSGSDADLYMGSGYGVAHFTTVSPSNVDEIEMLITDPAGSSVQGELRFPVSYTFSIPTAIRTTTWGRLKAGTLLGSHLMNQNHQ